MLPAGSPLSTWLTWLETLHPTEIELGLDRVSAVLERLDLEPPEHVLLIAGTNGKGSSVAMTSALLQAAGLRVGAYTSPHIVDYNERIAILDGEGRRLAKRHDALAIAALRDLGVRAERLLGWCARSAGLPVCEEATPAEFAAAYRDPAPDAGPVAFDDAALAKEHRAAFRLARHACRQENRYASCDGAHDRAHDDTPPVKLCVQNTRIRRTGRPMLRTVRRSKRPFHRIFNIEHKLFAMLLNPIKVVQNAAT